MEPQLAALIATGNVSFVFKDFVLQSHRPYSQWAAEAAQCAADQDKFWAFNGYLLTHQGQNTQSDLKGFAAKLGLDTTQFNACLDGGKYVDAVNKSTQEAVGLNLSGTPTIFVNGKQIKNADFPQLSAIVKRELNRK